MQLKISNNQLYSNLITNITRYKVPEYNQDTGEITYVDDKVKYKDNDNTEYALYEQSDYTNYDKFLLDYFSAINSEIYDLLVFKEVKKNIDISKAVCTYINSNGKIGIAIGTQDAFFSNGA